MLVVAWEQMTQAENAGNNEQKKVKSDSDWHFSDLYAYVHFKVFRDCIKM